MRAEHRDQAGVCPFAPSEVSVLAEPTLGHLRYSLTDVPPQSNSLPGGVLESDRARGLTRRPLLDATREHRRAAEATRRRLDEPRPIGDPLALGSRIP